MQTDLESFIHRFIHRGGANAVSHQKYGGFRRTMPHAFRLGEPRTHTDSQQDGITRNLPFGPVALAVSHPIRQDLCQGTAAEKGDLPLLKQAGQFAGSRAGAFPQLHGSTQGIQLLQNGDIFPLKGHVQRSFHPNGAAADHQSLRL